MRYLNPTLVLGAAMFASTVSAQKQVPDEQPATLVSPVPAAPSPTTPPQPTYGYNAAETERIKAIKLRDEARARVMVVQSRMEKASFLGVSGSPPAAALQEQLKLPRGIGMVIEFVEPKSPAENAGLKVYDVLHKLDDQLIVNAHQLAVLVRMHKPGDEVALTLIHQSESRQIKVKLIEKEVMALDEKSPWGTPSVEWNPPESTAVRNGLRYLELQSGSANPNRLQVGTSVSAGDGILAVRTTDESGTTYLEQTKAGRRLSAVDKNGKVIFEGPVDTEEQRKALPPDLQEKLKRMPSGTAAPADSFPVHSYVPSIKRLFNKSDADVPATVDPQPEKDAPRERAAE